MNYGIKLTGHYNFSDVAVFGNRFYAPNRTMAGLFGKEYGDEVAPSRHHNNEVADSAATSLTPSSPFTMKSSSTNSVTSGFQLQGNGSSNAIAAFYENGTDGVRNGSTSAIDIKANATSFLNGGNVAIGQTSATAKLDVAGSAAAASAFRIRSGTDPTSPNDGDIWYDGTNIKMRVGGVTNSRSRSAK